MEASQATSLRPARPAFSVSGREQARLADALLSLRIDETVDGLYRCEATFGNWGPKDGRNDFLYFDRKLLEFGNAFIVELGADPLFEGRISALEGAFPSGGSPSVTVLAEDRFQDLRMTRRTRTFHGRTDADVARAIAGEHGLRPDVSLPGREHKVLAQLNQSDLAFLRERARALGAEVWVTGRTLAAKQRTARRAGKPLTLAHGADLREARVIADLADQRTSVDVAGWDVAHKDALKATASESVLGGELASMDGGATVLRRLASRERQEAVANAMPLTSEEAHAWAESIFRRRARRFLVARGTAQTQAGLRVGATVKLQQLGPLFNGDYYVSEVCHRFDGAEGLRTTFVAERPGLGQA